MSCRGGNRGSRPLLPPSPLPSSLPPPLRLPSSLPLRLRPSPPLLPLRLRPSPPLLPLRLPASLPLRLRPSPPLLRLRLPASPSPVLRPAWRGVPGIRRRARRTAQAGGPDRALAALTGPVRRLARAPHRYSAGTPEGVRRGTARR
ncbi:hypothetical protein ABIA32_003456 [Streptacidiphilus sp. MAP12-20]|uniref:hypothetical protein n=1 Tax=Streptacidiphilus sp. MAP12-20 TaxID=3156299 RepID=UPI0035132D6D